MFEAFRGHIEVKLSSLARHIITNLRICELEATGTIAS